MFDDAVEEIRKAVPAMSPQQQKVGLYLCEHPDAIGVLSLSELAVKIGISGPTVNRFCRSLGYRGFLDFSRTMQGLRNRQLSYASYFQGSSVRDSGIREDGALGRLLLAADGDNTRKLQENYPTEKLKQCVAMMKQCSSMAVIGRMSAYPAAVYFEQLLSRVTPRLLPMSGSGVLQAAAISRLDNKSLVFAMDFPGYSKTTVTLVREAAQRGAAIVAITDGELSPLAELSALLFTVDVEMFSYINLFGPVFALINVICVEFGLAQSVASEKSLSKYDKVAESAFFLASRKIKKN